MKKNVWWGIKYSDGLIHPGHLRSRRIAAIRSYMRMVSDRFQLCKELGNPIEMTTWDQERKMGAVALRVELVGLEGHQQ